MRFGHHDDGYDFAVRDIYINQRKVESFLINETGKRYGKIRQGRQSADDRPLAARVKHRADKPDDDGL